MKMITIISLEIFSTSKNVTFNDMIFFPPWCFHLSVFALNEKKRRNHQKNKNFGDVLKFLL